MAPEALSLIRDNIISYLPEKRKEIPLLSRDLLP